MKKLFSLTCLIFTMLSVDEVNAQKKAGEKIKRAINQKIDQKTTEAIDKGLDKSSEGLVINFIAKNDLEDIHESTEETEDSVSATDDEPLGTLPTDTIGFGVYTKFTFEPGNKMIFYDDFTKDKPGDFPVQWETNNSGEIVTNSRYVGNWFSFTGRSGYLPSTGELPDNYTIEFDMVTNGITINNSATSVTINFLDKKSFTAGAAGHHGHLYIDMSSGHTMAVGNTGAEETPRIQAYLNRNFLPDQKVHFSIAVNKKRLRVWMNEDKIVDNPSLLVGNMGRYVLFETDGIDPDQGHVVLLSNMKISESNEDIRSRLLDNGRFSTTGIYFNTDKAIIKPESYAILKSVADYLNENPKVRILIIGHTDAQGDEDYNQKLSEKRALAVINALIEEFRIDKSRLQSAGKGESEPVDDNSTEKGRANNRRVEFVKIQQ